VCGSFRSAPASPAAGDFTIEDRRYLQDVEALAKGQSEKSRTLKELGRPETPEEAHRLLLAAGIWTIWENPHPERFGLIRESAKAIPLPPPAENRLDLTAMTAFAIDSPWSDDPDDAISLEGPDAVGSYCLWVHVADPASSVIPGSQADTEARDRGATLYLPEGAFRMLAPEALPIFALRDSSPALSFKITLKPDLSVGEVAVHLSKVKVTRLSYEEADALIAAASNIHAAPAVADGSNGTAAVLTKLAALAERNIKRRLDAGAVIIDLPEAHMRVDLAEKQISITPIKDCFSAKMVRECMLWAGEATARWAFQNQLPFPFIRQEAEELSEQKQPGLAGSWQMRRCMRPRNLSAKPGAHAGLGLAGYTQVTSPLRRYTDLVCHQQIRSFLCGQKTLSEEEILLRVSAAEAAASAASKAEKASRSYWIAVYLSAKKDSVWEAIVLDRKGNKGIAVIPALGFETQVSLRGNEKPNDIVSLKLLSVNIPLMETGFVAV
jgi:exoribonuclease-2